MLRFATKFADGEFKNCKIFVGLVQAYLQGHERKLEGKSLCKITYSPELDMLSHSLYARSPQAYCH